MQIFILILILLVHVGTLGVAGRCLFYFHEQARQIAEQNRTLALQNITLAQQHVSLSQQNVTLAQQHVSLSLPRSVHGPVR